MPEPCNQTSRPARSAKRSFYSFYSTDGSRFFENSLANLDRPLQAFLKHIANRSLWRLCKWSFVLNVKNEAQKMTIKYAGFWIRVWATIIDGLIFGIRQVPVPPSAPLNIFLTYIGRGHN